MEVRASMNNADRRSRKRRVTTWASVTGLLFVLSLMFGAVVASAQAADPQPDPSGIQTGSGADLAGVAPGTLTPEDFTAAASSEPFAVKLADMVNQNRLG